MFRLLQLFTLSATFFSSTTAADTLNSKLIAHEKDFWGGVVRSLNGNLGTATALTALLKSEFGGITISGPLDWSAIEPSRGTFIFSNSDTIVNWAISNGKLIRGESLVWHSQLPSWVSSISDKATLISAIQNHITTLAGRYKGKFYSWDVCNEVLNQDGSLRSSVFYNVLGESFITIAFQAARAADNVAKLYINDYGLDSNNTKVQGITNLVKRINTPSKLIDGIGSQMHLSAGEAGGVQAALATLSSAGVDIAISSLDIPRGGAADYITITQACLDTPACVLIVTQEPAGYDGLTGGPLVLWNAQYQPTAAYRSLLASM